MSRRAFMSSRSYSGAALSVSALQRKFDESVDHRMKVIAPEDRTRPGDDLTSMQKLALLQMMNSTLARGVASKLKSNEGIQGRPSVADYSELSRRGYCHRLSFEQYHELTYQGAQYAQQVLGRLCQDMDIHHIITGEVTGSGKDTRTYFKCSCQGWGRSFQGNGQFAWRRAVNAFHEHWNPMARGVEG